MTLGGLIASAQVDVSNLATTYAENFNTLPTDPSSQQAAWADNSTLADWYADHELGSLNIRYGGSYATGGSSGSAMYSYGDRTIPDMALGVITNNSSGDIAFAIKYENTSGQTIQSVTVSYTGEQWRISNGQRPQVLGFSYIVSDTNPSIALPERTSGYTYVPELFFTSPRFDTTGLALGGATGMALDGNLSENRVSITFSFNVTVPDGDFVLFRWYKENTTKIEFGLGIDDLSVDFSASALTSLTFNSNAPIYHYINGPIDLRIPDDDDTETYDPPTTVESMVMDPEETAFRSLIQNMLGGNYGQVRTDAPGIGYELVTFVDVGNGNQQHYVLRHNGVVDNPHHWGTYIFNTSPDYANAFISVPHPVHDRFTARQGGYLYQELNVAGIEIAGNYRCSSNTSSGCHGTTSVCSGNTDFRESDAAHSDEMPFHYASEEIANDDADNYFIQLHGFSFVSGDPDLIVSNGTDQTPSGSDRVVDFVDHIDNNSSFNAAGVHSDPYTAKLTGYTNTLGRFLNAHQSDICTSNQIANSSTDRFIHVEQREELREIESNYDLVGAALMQALSSPLPLSLTRFYYQYDQEEGLLKWETQTAYNVDYIEVLASVDGQSFDAIGRLQAINEDGTVRYQFPLPKSPWSYYRLRVVDFDKKTNYSEILFVPRDISRVSVYPTRFDRALHLSAPAGSAFSITDTMGRPIAAGCMDQPEITIDLSHLKKGLYLVRIETGRQVVGRRVVKL